MMKSIETLQPAAEIRSGLLNLYISLFLHTKKTDAERPHSTPALPLYY